MTMNKIIGFFAATFIGTIGSANAHGIVDTYGYVSYSHDHVSGVPDWHAPDAHRYHVTRCRSACGGYWSNASYSPSFGGSYAYFGNSYNYPATSYSLLPYSYGSSYYSSSGTLADPLRGISATQGCAGCNQKLQETAKMLRDLSKTANGREAQFQQLHNDYRNLWHEYQRITSQASLN